MTREEILLFKELIKETVKSVVKETIKEELAVVKKDLKEAKLLVAKSIKESRNAVQEASTTAQYSQNPENFRTKLREMVGSDFNPAPAKKTILPKLSEETAMNMSMNGSLPDIDAPIPFINKNSVVWKDMASKVN